MRQMYSVPLTEPVESSQNGIWTTPPKVVELHFAPTSVFVRSSWYSDSASQNPKYVSGQLCRTAFCLVPRPQATFIDFYCVYSLPAPRLGRVLLSSPTKN